MSGGHIVVIKRTGLDGSRFPLLSGSVTVGKGQDCDIRVLLNTVSDEQCIITVNKNQSVIKNLSSSYVTVVNGEPIEVRALEDGDVITVGDRSLRWEYLVKPSAQKVQMLKTTEKVKVSRKKSGPNLAQGRRSEVAAKRVDAQIKKMLDLKSRNSIASLPSVINTRQIAVVKPQRRSLDLTNKEINDEGAGDAPSPGTPSRRRKEMVAGLTTQPKRTPINNKNEKKVDLKPKLVTKPHRGKSMSPAQKKIIKTRYSDKADTANTKNTPTSISTRGSAKKNYNKTALSNSIPKARTTPAKVMEKKSVPSSTPGKRNVVTKIQAPVTMDENKKAALMILTGRSPIKKNLVTPSKKTVKVEPPVKNLLGKLESGQSTPKYVVPKKSPAKNVVGASKTSSRFTPKLIGSVKKSVAVNHVAKSPGNPRVSRRGAGTPKISPKKNISNKESLNESINISTSRISPSIVFRSALKSPINKSARKSETIKFDLSNLDLDNKSIESPRPLKRKFSILDSESPDSRKIRLCYSDTSITSDSKSPSPHHSDGGRQPSAISRRSNVSLRSSKTDVSSDSLELSFSNSVTQSRSRKSNISIIPILDNSIDRSIKGRLSHSSMKQKDSDLFTGSIVLSSKSNSFSGGHISVTEKMNRRSRSMNDIETVMKSTLSTEKTKENASRKSRNIGKESLPNRSSLRRLTKNSPSSSMVSESPKKGIGRLTKNSPSSSMVSESPMKSISRLAKNSPSSSMVSESPMKGIISRLTKNSPSSSMVSESPMKSISRLTKNSPSSSMISESPMKGISRLTKNSPSSSMVSESPMKVIGTSAKLSKSVPKSQKSSSLSLRRRTYSVEENDQGLASNSSLSGLLLTERHGDGTYKSPSTPEGSESMSNEASTPVLSLQHLLNRSDGNSSVARVQDAIKHFESIGLPKTPEPTKRLTRRTLGAIGERIQRRMSEISAKPEGKCSTDPRKKAKLTRITKSYTSRSLSNVNVASIKKIVGRRQISAGNKEDGSVDSDATDENAAKPDNSLVITPKSTVKLLPEVVKEKHSTARKPFSKKSIIDNLNESQDIVKQLFSSPVKRKLSQSMNQLSASQLSDEEPDIHPKNKMTRRSKGTPNVSFDFDSIKTPKVPTEMFVSPLDKSRKSSTLNVIGVKKLFEKNSPKNDLRNVRGIKKLMISPHIQKSPLNDLTRVVNLKQILQTPGRTKKSPKNDLSNVAGVKRLLRTPKGKQKSPKNDLTNVAGIKKLLSTPGKGKKSPKNDLTNIAGVKKLLESPVMQNSPVNDLTNVTGVKKMFASPRGKQKSPINDLTNIRGVKQMLASPRARKSPRNDLTNISSIKSLFGKDDVSPSLNKSKNSNMNKSRKVSVVEDISGVEELLNTSRSTTKDHEVSSRSEALFDQMVGRPQIKSYSRGRSLGRVNEDDTKRTENRSLPTSYNIGAWLKEIEMQSPISKKEKIQLNKFNQSYKVPKELNNLTIDMVENDVVFDPNQRSTRRTTGPPPSVNISLPLKKRGRPSSRILIADKNDKSRSQYDINISLGELDVSTKSGKRSSKSCAENNASLPLKKRVLLKKQDTSTPVKAKKPQDLDTIDLGPVSPISKLSSVHDSTELPKIIPPVVAELTTERRSNRQNLPKTLQNETTTKFSPKSKRSTSQKKQDATSESYTTIEHSSSRRGRSKKVVDDSKGEQKGKTSRGKINTTVHLLSEKLELPNNEVVSSKKSRLRRGVESVEKELPDSPKATRVVRGRKPIKEINKSVEAEDITESIKGKRGRKNKANDTSSVNENSKSNNSQSAAANRKKRGKQSKDEDLVIVEVLPPKRSARGRKKVDNSPHEAINSVDTSIKNVVKPKRGKGSINKGTVDEGTPKTDTKDQEASDNVIDGPPAGATKTSGRGRRKKEHEIKDESAAQTDNAAKGRRGRKVGFVLPVNTSVQKNVSDTTGDNQDLEVVKTKPTTRGRRKANPKEQEVVVAEPITRQSKKQNTRSPSKNDVPELPVRSRRQRNMVA